VKDKSYLSEVEGELLTLQDVAIGATRLAGSGAETGVQTTSLELLLEGTIELAALQALSNLVLKSVRLLSGLLLLLLLSLLGSGVGGNLVVLLIVLTEGSGVDLNDGTLNESVGADQLVGGGVVSDTQDTSLTSNGYKIGNFKIRKI
jgi:hypothetical protein